MDIQHQLTSMFIQYLQQYQLLTVFLATTLLFVCNFSSFFGLIFFFKSISREHLEEQHHSSTVMSNTMSNRPNRDSKGPSTSALAAMSRVGCLCAAAEVTQADIIKAKQTAQHLAESGIAGVQTKSLLSYGQSLWEDCKPAIVT